MGLQTPRGSCLGAFWSWCCPAANLGLDRRRYGRWPCSMCSWTKDLLESLHMCLLRMRACCCTSAMTRSTACIGTSETPIRGHLEEAVATAAFMWTLHYKPFSTGTFLLTRKMRWRKLRWMLSWRTAHLPLRSYGSNTTQRPGESVKLSTYSPQ